jgi:FkbM family methyltransferase
VELLAHDPRYSFEARDGCWSDAVVVREIFCENVYQVSAGDLADSAIVVDLGANIGVFGTYCHSLIGRMNQTGHPLRVYSYEPQPDNLALLEANVARNKLEGVVVPVAAAVGGVARSDTITNQQGGSALSAYAGTEYEAAPCRVVTLADVWEEHGLSHVDVLKVDVEGAETEIICETSTELLGQCRYIVVEYDNASGGFGAICEQLSRTHQVHTMGSVDRGAYIYARRY